MKKIIFILITVFGLTNASAQVSYVHLSFGSSGVLFSDTVNEGDFLPLSFWIKNTGNIALNSSIDVNVSIMYDSLIVSNNSLGSFNTVGDTLNPGDSVYIATTVYVSSQAFKLGDNIVVIWPAAIGPYPITTDEFVASVFVNAISGIASNGMSKLQIFPNPISSSAQIKTDKNIKSIKLIDILGNTVRNIDVFNSRSILFHKEELGTGIYFIELVLENEILIQKIIIK